MTESNAIERVDPTDPRSSPDTPLFKGHMKRYEFANRVLKKGRILDLACGSGYGTAFLASVDGRHLVGVDNDKVTVDNAMKRYDKNNIEFHMMNATSLSLKDSDFDGIVSFETIEHVSDYKKMIQEMHRILKQDGILILSTPNEDTSARNNPFHLKEFAKDEIIQLLNPYFKSIEIYGQENWESFDDMSKKLHLRWLSKKMRNDSFFDVKNLYKIPKEKIENFVIVCHKK